MGEAPHHNQRRETMYIATLQIDYYGPSSDHIIHSVHDSKAKAIEAAEEIDAGTVQDGVMRLGHNEYSRSGCALVVVDKFREGHDDEAVIEGCAEINADSVIVRAPMAFFDTLVCVPVE
tara:strand:+ start:935 stop:1291 length:357 start_codon:yes stop_codon:yes gene_type:complete